MHFLTESRPPNSERYPLQLKQLQWEPSTSRWQSEESLQGFLHVQPVSSHSTASYCGLRSGLWLSQSRALCFLVFHQTLVDLLVCFGSLSLIRGRIHGGFYDGELARSCWSRASPNHDISTSMLHNCYEECCIWFTPNTSSVLVSKSFNFRLICPKNFLPKVLVCLYVLSGKLQPGLQVSLRGFLLAHES